MLDQRIYKDVVSDAQKAMHGDEAAHEHLHMELKRLSKVDLKELTTELQNHFGAADANYFPGVKVETNNAKDVTALTFQPTIYDRLRNNAVSVENTLDPIGNSGASASFFRRIRHDYDNLPSKIRDYINILPLEIHAAGLTTEGDPNLSGEPSGYPKGSTYEAARGLTEIGPASQHQQIVMSEYYKNSDAPPQKSDDVENTFLHEVGHVVDQRMGTASYDWPRPDGNSFSQAYSADLAKMPAAVRAELDYYIRQPKDGSSDLRAKSEAFAESFCIDENGTPPDRKLFEKYFSHTLQEVRRLLKERDLLQ